MAAGTDHLRTVPAEEGAGREAHSSGVGDTAQADRAPFALIGDGPAKSKETYGEAPHELQAFGEWRVAEGVAVSEVERGGKADGSDERELCAEKCDSVDALADGWAMCLYVRVRVTER